MLPTKNVSPFISFFQKLHSLPKLLICLGIAFIVYAALLVSHIDFLTHLMISWDTFSLCMIVMTWFTFSITQPAQIREQSKIQDTSRTVIFFLVLIATIASFLAVLLLLFSKHLFKNAEIFHLSIALAGMVLSWFLIHTIYTLRYAHIFYGDDKIDPTTHAGGLIFPGNKKPEYLDFAYFSFVLGMTFQVSDVQITSKYIRRMAMWHGLLSFGYNTVMIALTINVIAGFGN